MKQLTLILLLLVSTNVYAEWTRVTGSVDGVKTVYIDYGTIKRTKNKVTIWRLLDHKTVQQFDKKIYLSSATHEEYDCEEETSRLLDMYVYSGNMSSGEVVISLKNIQSEATSIIPENIQVTFFKIVCDKK